LQIVRGVAQELSHGIEEHDRIVHRQYEGAVPFPFGRRFGACRLRRRPARLSLAVYRHLDINRKRGDVLDQVFRKRLERVFVRLVDRVELRLASIRHLIRVNAFQRDHDFLNALM
jgi:hypothetical protein